MRIVVSALLLVSGLLAVIADWQRWVPACSGGFESDACVTRQSDWYDYAPPGESWIPIGTTAPLMATSLALMALATLGLFRAVWRSRWAWVVGAVLAVPFGVLAATTYASVAAGHAVELPGTEVAWRVLAYAWPLALVPLWITGLTGAGPRTVRLARMAVAGLLILASPVALYLTATSVSMSHDTPPWTQAIGGAFTGLAGAALLLARPQQPRADAVPTEPVPAAA